MSNIVQRIRAKYPHPCRPVDDPNGYCVGGAACQYMTHFRTNFGSATHNNRFPPPEYLATILQEINPALKNSKDALTYAKAIIFASDRIGLEKAWSIMEEALTGTQPGPMLNDFLSIAPTNNGITELDELCEQYNDGEIGITELVCNIWNRAYYAGTKGK